MNLTHLKYAVEVAKTGSITQAAESLYMGQPNLSKAIRELEATVGVAIFKRTPKGVMLTPQGEEFIARAKNILGQIDEMENLFRIGRENQIAFSVCVPRASYITHAFTRFVNGLDMKRGMELNFLETNTVKTINNVIGGEYRLGVIRYQAEHEAYYNSLLALKGAETVPICEFEYLALMSKDHPLAQCSSLNYSMLEDSVEILHGDLGNPASSFSKGKESESAGAAKRRIYIYERGSQFNLLMQVPQTYMWVSPLPSAVLEQYGLVQRRCISSGGMHKDVLIYSKGYRLTELDKAFLGELYAVRDEVFFKQYS